MKKVLLYGLGTIVVLALLAYITLQFFLGSVVKAGVNRFGPEIARTNVELQSANLSPLSGAGTLTGLTVANPAGWTPGTAFYLGAVHVKMEPFSVFRDHIVVDDITIDRPEFTYETRLVSSNLGDILDNVEKSLGSEQGGNQPKAKNGRPLKLEVRHFLLRNGQVTLVAGPKRITVPMPPVELTNVGTGQGGVTPAGFAVAVMRNVTASVATAATEALAKQAGASGAAGTAAKEAAGVLQGLFGGGKKK